MSDTIPLVSIICPAYNHERFIAQTLDGFVMQKTTFPFEIIVHDDASTDSTAAIIRQYEQKHPHLFANIYQTENQFSKSIHKVPDITKAASRGKYIALCEGDDYWTDPFKLEKQVIFLEANAAFVGCFHNTEERYEGNIKASFLYCNYPVARNISFTDLSYSNVMPTCSIVFRRGLFNEFPEWHYKLKMGDWPHNLLNAQFGDFWFFPHVMGVHRLHEQSMWMLQDENRNRQSTIEAYDEMINGFESDFFRNQLQIAKIAFVSPPRKVTYRRRIANFLKKWM